MSGIEKCFSKNKNKLMMQCYKDILERIEKYCENGINYYKLMDKGEMPRQYDDDFVQERVKIETEYIFRDILKITKGE